MSLSVEQQELVEAIAQRTAGLLRDRQPPRLVDAATLAATLGLSVRAVHKHADLLGGMRLGDGPRPCLRFDPQVAVEAWTHRISSEGSQPPSSPEPLPIRRPRRTRRSGSGTDLLPVRGPRGAV